jgi:hypothetical protein
LFLLLFVFAFFLLQFSKSRFANQNLWKCWHCLWFFFP